VTDELRRLHDERLGEVVARHGASWSRARRGQGRGDGTDPDRVESQIGDLEQLIGALGFRDNWAPLIAEKRPENAAP
jgi:hypothetical protein